MSDPNITTIAGFGDVDYGPRAGANYIIRIGPDDDADAAAEALWQYLKANYEDDFQEYRRSTVSHEYDGDGTPIARFVQVIVLTTWGDGHRSTW